MHLPEPHLPPDDRKQRIGMAETNTGSAGTGFSNC